MAEDSKKHGQGDDKAKKIDQKLDKPDKSQQKQGGDYTTNMWHKIEGAVSKDKITGLKQELNHNNPAEVIHKRKRRRRRKKKIDQHQNVGMSQNAGLQQKTGFSEKVQDHKSPWRIPKFPQKDEKKEEKNLHNDKDEGTMADEKEEATFSDEGLVDEEENKVAFVDEEATAAEGDTAAEEAIIGEAKEEQAMDEMPPASQVEPVNPFSLPTRAQDPVFKDQEKSEKEKKITLENAASPFEEKAEDVAVKPINPFEIPDVTRPLDEKSLDEKPLDEVGRMAEPESAVYENPKSPEDLGEAEEGEEAVSGVADEVNSDENEIRESNEKQVIEVQAEPNENKIEPVFPENIDSNLNNGADDKEDLWSALEQAGITKKRAWTILVIVIVIVGIGIFFIFGGYKIFNTGWFTSDDKVEREAVKDVVDMQIEDENIPLIEKESAEPDDIIAAYIFGLEYAPLTKPIEAEPISSFGDYSGIDMGFFLGKTKDIKAEKFVEYVRLLEKMNNIYNVEIYSLVDLAVDRRKALDDYLKELDELINQGLMALENINADLQRINVQYEAYKEQQSQYENIFFSYLQNYYGQTAYDNLQLYAEASHEAAKLKAQYSAQSALRTKFISFINILRPRYKDIAVNAEALIKGVRIIDVPKSNIDAILPLE